VKEYLMRKSLIVIIAVAYTAAAPAQEALRCVNPDVLNSLVFNARAESKLIVKRSMPDVIAGFGAPADFKLIGSGLRMPPLSSTVVAYKTTLESAKALDNWLTFLMAEGWRHETTAPQQPMISVAGVQPLGATVCRNGERRDLRVREIAGVRYANAIGVATTPARPCNTPDPRQNGFDMGSQMAAINSLRANLPQFSFPATARMVGENGMGGMNGGNSASSSVRIASPDPALSLATQLGLQLGSQGWQRDANWNGALSTGSTWTRKPEGGSLFGTLEILTIGPGVYDVGFTVANRTQ
jgi:hypothetical protein